MDNAITVELPRGIRDSICYSSHVCACTRDDIMSGPFDETIGLVTQWLRDTHPYAIKGEFIAHHDPNA